MTRSLPLRFMLAFTFAIIAAGCGDDDKKAAPTTTTTDVWTFPAPAETAAVADASEETVTEQPEPNSADAISGQLAVLAESTAGDNADPDSVDPCSLVTTEDWTSFAGSGGTHALHIEDGDACGYIDASDQLRLAVAAYKRSDDGWLSASDATKGAAVNVTGVETAVWLTSYPVPASSTLVTQAKSHDIVIELSSRGNKTQDQLRDAAVSFAGKAVERMP